MFVRNISQKIWLISALCIGIVGVGGFFFYTRYASPLSIVDFVYETHAHEVLDIFEKDRYWLTSTPGYDADYMLKYRAPNKSILYQGKMHIKVLLDHGQVAGFTTYYMKPGNNGCVLFVAVGQQFRNKGYAKKIVRYDIEQLRRLGATRVTLLTRATNYPAQRVYESVGFARVREDEDYVYYSYPLQ